MNYINKSIVDLNNEAVSYLQSGNYMQAVYELEMGLERLQHYKNWDPYHHYHVTQYNQQFYYDAGTLRVSSVPIAPSYEKDDGGTNIFEFYRRAFRIESSSSLHPIMLLVVIKYNMAITYHDDAIRRKRDAHLLLALDLYDEILCMMQYFHIRGNMLLLLAIGNNMGFIHSRRMMFEQAREALYWTRQLAIASRQHVSLVPYHEFAFFYKTVIIFNGNDLNAAPAA